MLNEYHYILQRKVSIWEEMPFIISASSKEDADNIVDGLIANHAIEDLECLSEKNNLVKFNPQSTQLLPDTLEYLTIEDNGYNHVLEVMDADISNKYNKSYYKNEFLQNIG